MCGQAKQPIKPEYAAPLQQFNVGDRVVGRTDIDMSQRAKILRDGTVFEVLSFHKETSSLSPSSKGYYRLHRVGGKAEDTYKLNDYLFQPEPVTDANRFKPGDRVKLVRPTGWAFLAGKIGQVFTVAEVVGSKYPELGEGLYYLRIKEGLEANPTHTQPLNAFELVKEHPPVKYEDLLASNHANRRKRKQLRLLQSQNDGLRGQLETYREYQVHLLRLLSERSLKVKLAEAIVASATFARAPGETRGQSVQSAYAGHAAQGGLQNHSIGDEYPYIVVGYQEGPTEEVRFKILDAESGNFYAETFDEGVQASRRIKDFKQYDAERSDKPRTKIQPNGYFL